MTVVPQLTQDQKHASDKFFEFLMTDDKTFVLSGSAGVGKTFLMTYLDQHVLPEYRQVCKMLAEPERYFSVVYTATTNKAAEVLEQSLQRDVSTIHSFMGLKVNQDYKTGKTYLTKTNRWKIRYNMIVFIDESSMIDEQLYKIILETFVDSKIIFVGDHAQMAPVSETKSEVYLNVDPNNFVFLSQPIRNASSPALVSLCEQLRDTVETGVFRPIDAVPGSIEYLSDTAMQQKLHEYFKDPKTSARVLCYTNDRVQQFNSYIREEVRGLPKQFQAGDVLVVAKALDVLLPNTTSVSTLNVERKVLVQSISSQIYDDTFINPNFFDDNHPIQYRIADITALSGYQQSYSVWIPTQPDRVREAEKFFAKKKDWSAYFALKQRYADLRDLDCCTVYKSQGSTYHTVFVDIGNIGTSYDAEQVARMLFVAVSRATTKVYLYGRLPSRYQGARVA